MTKHTYDGLMTNHEDGLKISYLCELLRGPQGPIHCEPSFPPFVARILQMMNDTSQTSTCGAVPSGAAAANENLSNCRPRLKQPPPPPTSLLLLLRHASPSSSPSSQQNQKLAPRSGNSRGPGQLMPESTLVRRKISTKAMPRRQREPSGKQRGCSTFEQLVSATSKRVGEGSCSVAVACCG